jgi:hypothetical protein
MTRLEPCHHCRRHVKVDETACPFCASPLAFTALAPRGFPRAPIGRAALFAFGVLAAPACGDDDTGPRPDARTDAAISADAPVDATVDAAFDADPDEPDGSIAIYSSAPTTPPTTPPDPGATASG